MSTTAEGVFDRSPYEAPAADLVKGAEQTKDKLFSANGRVGVWRYNARFAQVMFVIIAAAAIMFGAMATGSEIAMVIVGIPVFLVAMAAIVAMVYTAIKRLHDLGHSGWFYLIGMIPIVGALFTLYYSFKPGVEDDNQYGAARQATQSDKVLGVIGMVLLVVINVAALIPMD